jgi:hypothetical protein
VSASSIENGTATDIRILVSFEDGFHAYQETIAAAIRIVRPNAEVITIEPVDIRETVKRFRPDVIIGSPLARADVEGVPAWVELSLDPAKPSRVNVNGCYSETVNPTLDKLLDIMDEVVPLF